MFCLHSSCRDDNTIQFNCIMLVWKIYINSVYIMSWKRPWKMFCRLKQIGEMNHFCLKQVQCLKAFSNTRSFIVHILPPFVDLYIIHYVLIAYSTLNIVSFVYIYTFINLFVFSLLNLFIYLSIFLRAVG